MSRAVEASLPARINVLGSPTDATEGAYATISAAITRRGGARAEAGRGLRFTRASGETMDFEALPVAESRGFDVEVAAVNALCRYAPELAGMVERQGVAVRTWTEIPRSSGLAGSSVMLLAVLAVLRAFYGLDPRRCNDYVLAEIAQRAEEHDLGVVCGFADRYVPLFGGLAYVSYHGKLWHAPLGEEPFATYEPLGTHVPPLELCVATTGVRRDSGAVHAPMRERYLSERRAGRGPLLEIARAIGETAWRGKIALLSTDLATFGRLITRNQELVDGMMQACGFASGAGDEVRLLIQAALAAGALGAKLTGAGGGGAIFALPGAGGAAALADAVRTAALRHGLESEVFVVGVSRTGLELRTIASAEKPSLPGRT